MPSNNVAMETYIYNANAHKHCFATVLPNMFYIIDKFRISSLFGKCWKVRAVNTDSIQGSKYNNDVNVQLCQCTSLFSQILAMLVQLRHEIFGLKIPPW